MSIFNHSQFITWLIQFLIMPTYDKAITIFAPDGNLFQVQYAFEAVNRGSCTVAVKGKDCIVFAVEKKIVAKLQDPRTIKKILPIDDGMLLTFAGLQADARVLIDKARLEAQSYRFQLEDKPSVEHIAKFIAETQQKFTQKGGVRPFGLSTFVMGFDGETPLLFTTEPSGALSQWKANVIGRNQKTVREYLEKHYEEGMGSDKAIKLAVESIMEIIENAKSIELVYMTVGGKYETLSEDAIQAVITQIEKEREEAASK